MATKYNEEAHAHFLTSGCYRHQHFFRDQNLCRLFETRLDFERMKGGFFLWAYVIMPNHIHVLLKPTPNQKISSIYQRIKKGFSHDASRYLQENDPGRLRRFEVIEKGIPKFRFWQAGGGYDRNVFGRESLLSTIDYIHNNPVRKGLVALPERWKWSSAGFWLTGNEGSVPIDVPEEWGDGG